MTYILCCRCQTVRCLRRITMKSTLNSWETSEAKSGGFKPMFMGTEARVLVEKRDTAYGLILLMITISTASSGPTLLSCKIKTLSSRLLLLIYSACFLPFSSKLWFSWRASFELCWQIPFLSVIKEVLFIPPLSTVSLSFHSMPTRKIMCYSMQGIDLGGARGDLPQTWENL